MKLSMVFLSILAMVLSTLIPCQPARSEVCNRVVAFVEDDVITLHELNSKIEEMTGQEPSVLESRDREQFMETRRQVLDLLIEDKIAEKRVEELGIEIDESDVDAAIERIKRAKGMTHEDLLRLLESRGMDYEEYRGEIKKDIQKARLISMQVKSKIIIREERIKEYYEQHLDDFRMGEKVHLAGILLENSDSLEGPAESLLAKAQEIVQRARSGESFAELAKKYSDGPGAQDGGDLGFFKPSDFAEDLADIINNLSEGEISDPITRSAGIQIIKLIERKEASVRSFDEVKDAIFEVLYRKEIEKRYSKWIKDLRDKTYTKVVF